MIVYRINIPLNEDGVREFEEYEKDTQNVKTFELSEEEYIYLRRPGGLFSKFDSVFGTIIDVCEEERIDSEYLTEALKLVDNELKKCNNEGCDAISKVKESIKLAIKAGTFWEIDVYLEHGSDQ